MSPEQALFFLERVKESRTVLFVGKNGVLYNEPNVWVRALVWEEIRTRCLMNGCIDFLHHNFRYLQNIVWVQLRDEAVAKAKNTPATKLDDCTRLVLEIMGGLEAPVARPPRADLPLIKQKTIAAGDFEDAGDFPPNDFLHDTSGDLTDEDEQEASGHVEPAEEPPRDFTPPATDFVRTAVEQQQQPKAAEDSPTASDFDEPDETWEPRMKRMRMMADIRKVDAQTKRLIAETQKLKAEAELARLKALEMVGRLQVEQAAPARPHEPNDELNVVD